MTIIAQDAAQGNSHAKNSDPTRVIVAKWPIKRGEVARVSIDLYKSTWLINVRRWFEADDGAMRRSKGIAIAIKHLPQLADAITDALTVARERGFLVDEREGGDEPAR